MNSPFTKITYILIPPLPLWRNSSDLSEMLSPGLQFSFCHPTAPHPRKKNLTHNSNIVHLLFAVFKVNTHLLGKYKFCLQQNSLSSKSQLCLSDHVTLGLCSPRLSLLGFRMMSLLGTLEERRSDPHMCLE